MATATADLHNVNRVISSATTIVGPEGAGGIEITSCNVYPGVEISIDEPKATGIVIRPFIIELTPSEEGYMATSRISNAFELGSTLFQAARNYLEFLVDEVLWLQKNVEQLSPSIQEDLRLLQSYLRIM